MASAGMGVAVSLASVSEVVPTIAIAAPPAAEGVA